jgi:hypothetical protein
MNAGVLPIAHGPQSLVRPFFLAIEDLLQPSLVSLRIRAVVLGRAPFVGLPSTRDHVSVQQEDSVPKARFEQAGLVREAALARRRENTSRTDATRSLRDTVRLHPSIPR